MNQIDAAIRQHKRKKNTVRSLLHGVLTPAVTFLLVALIVAVTMRTIAYLRYYDPATSYLTDHFLSNISMWVAGVSAVLLFSLRLFAPHREDRVASFATPITAVPSGLCGTLMLAFSLRLLSLPSAVAPQRFLALLAGILGIGGACHFLLNACIRNRRSVLRALFSLFTVLFLAIYATYLYFDRTTPLNAPSKIASQMAYLFSSLFFLYEARISLGREKWSAYFPLAMVMTMLTGYASIPDLLLLILRGREATVSIYDPVLLFALFLYALSRVILTALLPADKPSPAIVALRQALASEAPAGASDEGVVPEIPAAGEAEEPAVPGADGVQDALSTQSDAENAVAEEPSVTTDEHTGESETDCHAPSEEPAAEAVAPVVESAESVAVPEEDTVSEATLPPTNAQSEEKEDAQA